MGQLSSNSTGQLMDNSMRSPARNTRLLQKATPPLPISTVNPVPASTTFPLRTNL
jgi:hypothetical protein